jgi:hypothetical protein
MKRLFSKFIFIVCLTICFYSNASEIIVGNVNIDIPDLAGFTAIGSEPNEIIEISRGLCPSTYRLLSVFLTKEDAEKFMLDRSGNYDRYLVLQSLKEFEKDWISEDRFKEIRILIRNTLDSQLKDQSEFLKKTGENLTKTLNKAVEIKVGEIMPLGIDFESADSISYSQLAKTELISGERKIETDNAGSITTVLVKGKVIYLFVYSRYRTDEDIEWVRKTAEEYTKKILSKNDIMEMAAKELLDDYRLNASDKEDKYEENSFLSLLLPMAVVIGIGLVPALLIRYAIYKIPLPKKLSIITSLLFLVVNIFIFIALEKRSIIHIAIFLSALASFFILNRGYSAWKKDQVEKNS